MGRNINNIDGLPRNLGILTPVLSGALFGASSFCLKLTMIETEINVFLILNLLTNLFSWLALIFAAAGFYLFQISLNKFKIGFVTSTMTGAVVIVPSVCGILILNEGMNLLKAFAILMIVLGTFLVSKD